MTSTFNTDCRAFLAAAPALAALTAGPALAASSAVDPDFERCLRSYRVAAEEGTRFDRTISEPANKRFEAETAAVPHITTGRIFESETRGRVPWTTADPIMCAIAQEMGPHSPGSIAAELLAAINRREAAIAEIRRRHRIDEINRESDRLGEVGGHALRAVENYSVRSMSDLIRKLEISASESPVKKI
jgi:hypothetical protein